MKPLRLSLQILPLLLLPPAIAAQEEPEPAGAAPTEVYVVPAEHASARATMRTFLESFDPARRDPDAAPLELAAACLDLSEISRSLREYQGRELALQLKEILDKTELIELDALSDDPGAPPYRLQVFDQGQVVIAPEARGEWLFDTETVRSIPRLVSGVRDRAILEGVTEVEVLTPSMWLRSKMPGSLLGVGFVLEHWQWLFLLLLLAGGLLLDRLVTGLLRTLAARFWLNRLATLDAKRRKRAIRPLGLLAAALFWWAGIYWLGLPAGVLEVLRLAAHFVVATSFVWGAYRLVDVLGAVLEQRAEQTGNKLDDLLVPMLRKIAKALVTVFGLLFIADALDLPLRSILLSFGIGGLAVALAAQDLIKNLFGSLLVIMDQPFSVGDYIEVGGVGGTVEELGFRSTRLRTVGDTVVTLPNSNLITTSVNNFSVRRYRRWKTMLALAYDTPPDKIEAFCDGARELIRRHPDTRKEGYQVAFYNFGTSSLEIVFQLQLEVPGYGAELVARQQLGLDILRLAADLGVEMAFPTQTVHVHNADRD